MKRTYKTLLLMPYLSIADTMLISGFRFVSVKNSLEKYVRDVATAEHVRKIAAMYKSPSGHVVENPTIVLYRDDNFRALQGKTMAKLANIRAMLLFAAYLKNNSWSFSTAENFNLVIQRFNVGDDGLALQGGSLHGILAGGLKISKTIFTTEPHIHVSSFNLGLEKDVMTALVKCLNEEMVNPKSSALLRSLRQFLLIYSNSHQLDSSARVLGMIMAFELLFGTTNRGNFRESIKKYADEYSPTEYDYEEIYTGGVQRRPPKKLRLNGAQIWAEEFYKLRNRIIHGDVITTNDYAFRDMYGMTFKHGNPHIAMAYEIYAVCLTNYLREMGRLAGYHLMLVEKGKYLRTDKNLMGIKNREFTIVDKGLLDYLSGIV